MHFIYMCIMVILLWGGQGWAQLPPERIFDIKAYGAIGDDKDETAIQNTTAIRAAIMDIAAAGGGTLYIPNGTYRVRKVGTSSIILGLKSNTHVRCESHASVLKFHSDVPSGITPSMRLMGVVDTVGGLYENMSVTGCAFDGNMPVPNGIDGQSHALMFYSATGFVRHVRIRDNRIFNVPADGVQMSANTREFWVQNNLIWNFGRTGIGAGGGTSGIIVRGAYHILNNTLTAATSVASSRGMDLELVSNMNDIVIMGNVTNELQVAGGPPIETNGRWIISNNRVTSGSVQLGGCSDVTITGNEITAGQIQGGIDIIQLARNTTIVGNTIIREVVDGPCINLISNVIAGSHVLVNANMCRNTLPGSTATGIHTDFITNLTLTDNRVTGYRIGISAQGSLASPMDDLMVMGNTFLGDTHGGIFSGKSTRLHIAGNTFAGTVADLLLAGGASAMTQVFTGRNHLVNALFAMTGTVIYTGYEQLAARVIVTGTHTVTTTERYVRCNSAAPFSITLPPSLGAGRLLEFKNIGTGVCTIVRAGANTIDGLTSVALPQYAYLSLIDAGVGTWDRHP